MQELQQCACDLQVSRTRRGFLPGAIKNRGAHQTKATTMIGSRIVVPALRSALAPWTLTSSAVGAYLRVTNGKRGSRALRAYHLYG